MRNIVIVGSQFGDPALFVRWIQEAFHQTARSHVIGDHDRVSEMIIAEPEPIRIVAALPPHWDANKVYEHAFAIPPDALLLVLTAIRSLGRANTQALQCLQPYFLKCHAPVVIANDAHGKSAAFPTVTAEEIKTSNRLMWDVRSTMIGDFSEGPLRWTDGARETWSLLL